MSLWPLLPGVLGVITLYGGASGRPRGLAPRRWLRLGGLGLCLVALGTSAATAGGRGFVITLGVITLTGWTLALVSGGAGPRARRARSSHVETDERIL